MPNNDNHHVFTASSRGPRGMNQDGTRNVFCWKCNQFISRTEHSFSRAICAICTRIEEGLPITEQMLTDYDLSKAGQIDVTAVTLREERKQEPRKDRRTSLSSLGNGILKAIGLAPAKQEEAPSVRTSKSKRLKPLFGDDVAADPSDKP